MMIKIRPKEELSTLTRPDQPQVVARPNTKEQGMRRVSLAIGLYQTPGAHRGDDIHLSCPMEEVMVIRRRKWEKLLPNLGAGETEGSRTRLAGQPICSHPLGF